MPLGHGVRISQNTSTKRLVLHAFHLLESLVFFFLRCEVRVLSSCSSVPPIHCNAHCYQLCDHDRRWHYGRGGDSGSHHWSHHSERDVTFLGSFFCSVTCGVFSELCSFIFSLAFNARLIHTFSLRTLFFHNLLIHAVLYCYTCGVVHVCGSSSKGQFRTVIDFFHVSPCGHVLCTRPVFVFSVARELE